MIIRVLRILIIPFILALVAVSIISNKHPIFVKWLIREARCVGRPIKSSVYVDGHLDRKIILYRANTLYAVKKKVEYFIVIFPRLNERMYDNIFILVGDGVNNDIGLPMGTTTNDYDSILGCLFQSETGAHYAQFTDDIKGFDFNPKLTFNHNKITFNMPQREEVYKCDSIRIEL